MASNFKFKKITGNLASSMGQFMCIPHGIPISKILSRIKEPSTLRGITMGAAAVGISISPEMIEQIIMIGMGLSGFIAMITDDS